MRGWLRERERERERGRERGREREIDRDRERDGKQSTRAKVVMEDISDLTTLYLCFVPSEFDVSGGKELDRSGGMGDEKEREKEKQRERKRQRQRQR